MDSNINRKELKVSAIENGTVIDHIPAKNLFRVVNILELERCENPITVGSNLESKKFGQKGIIKVSNKFFKDDEINKIALVAPTATLIEIRDFKVASKREVSVPDEVRGFIRCFNPKCITNFEAIETQFDVIDKKETKLFCRYCEKVTKKENIEFI